FHAGAQLQSGRAAVWIARAARNGRHHRTDANGVRSYGPARRLPQSGAQPEDRGRTGAAAVMADEKRPSGNGRDDDSYVLEDTGESIEDLEHEIEIAAKEAADSTENRRRPRTLDTPVPTAAPPAENVDFKDRYLRTLADFENFRKRSEREKQDFFKYALAGLMKELLPVLDNFDRFLEHAAEGDD